MIMVNVNEVKAKLSLYLEQVERGERVVICRRNVPVAELRPFDAPRKEPRPVGLARGAFEIGPEFHAPLPEEILRSFEADE